MDGLGWERVCSSHSDLGWSKHRRGTELLHQDGDKALVYVPDGHSPEKLSQDSQHDGTFVGREEMCEIQLSHASISKWCVGSSAAGKWSERLSHEAESHGVCSQVLAVYGCGGCVCEEQGKPTGCEYSLLSMRDLWLLLCTYLHQET